MTSPLSKDSGRSSMASSASVAELSALKLTYIDRTMELLVAQNQCQLCKAFASTPDEYQAHLASHPGEVFIVYGPRNTKKRYVHVQDALLQCAQNGSRLKHIDELVMKARKKVRGPDEDSGSRLGLLCVTCRICLYRSQTRKRHHRRCQNSQLLPFCRLCDAVFDSLSDYRLHCRSLNPCSPSIEILHRILGVADRVARDFAESDDPESDDEGSGKSSVRTRDVRSRMTSLGDFDDDIGSLPDYEFKRFRHVQEENNNNLSTAWRPGYDNSYAQFGASPRAAHRAPSSLQGNIHPSESSRHAESFRSSSSDRDTRASSESYVSRKRNLNNVYVDQMPTGKRPRDIPLEVVNALDPPTDPRQKKFTNCHGWP